MKEWYTAQDLADLSLTSLPNTKAGVIYRAKKNGWLNRKRSGRGGGVEYAFDSLPSDVQAEIKARHIKAMMPIAKPKQSTKLAEVRDTSELSDADRRTADARQLMALLVSRYEVELGSRNKALKHISDLSRQNALPLEGDIDYNDICNTALAKKRGQSGVGTRKLHEWCINAQKCKTPTDRLQRLAPKKQGQPVIDPLSMPWMGEFMNVYCQPNGISIAEAYRQFAPAYQAIHGEVPSYTAVRAGLLKLPPWVREQKRLTGAAMRGLRAFVRRDWNAPWMKANDIWVGDGHSLKMIVAHPQHGSPFKPELTLVIDAPSRLIVGWSLGYSESQIAVGDALRYAMQRHGVPAIYYSDNGSGQKNKTFDADVTGVFARLGIQHATGIPGNPQGRGIIERQMKEVPKRVAMSFPTYFGEDADPESTRKMLSAMGSYANALVKKTPDDKLTDKQNFARRRLPRWQELLDEIERQVQDYNCNRVHSAIKMTPQAKRTQLLAQMDSKDIVMLSDVEVRDLFRPSFKRDVERGEVRWDNKWYRHKALEPLHGDSVMVYVDQHDASSVIVRDMDGRFICEAGLSRSDAFARTYVEKAQDDRAKAQMKRVEDKQALLKAQNTVALEHDALDTLVGLTDIKDVTPADEGYALWESEVDPDWSLSTALKAVNH